MTATLTWEPLAERTLPGYPGTMLYLMECADDSYIVVIDDPQGRQIFNGLDERGARDYFMHPFACGYNYRPNTDTGEDDGA